jgi:hypothetical protein
LFEEMLRFVLINPGCNLIHLSVNDTYWRQIRGVAMGACISPFVAG